MTSYTPADDQTVSLRVRTRRTLESDGSFEVARTVPCARQDREVPLQTCTGCERCRGLIPTNAGCDTQLRCLDPERAAEAVAHLPLPVARATSHGRSAADRTPLSAIMTADVLCVRADVTMEAVATLLLERGISGVPVVDMRGAPLGLISKTDLVREYHEGNDVEHNPPRSEREIAAVLGSGFHGTRDRGTTVEAAMTGIAFALAETESVAQAAALMAYEGVHRIPVTCPDGRVVGVVSALDILRWVARQEGYLARN